MKRFLIEINPVLILLLFGMLPAFFFNEAEIVKWGLIGFVSLGAFILLKYQIKKGYLRSNSYYGFLLMFLYLVSTNIKPLLKGLGDNFLLGYLGILLIITLVIFYFGVKNKKIAKSKSLLFVLSLLGVGLILLITMN